MRRSILIPVIAAVFMGLAAPATAVAGGPWAVKNSSGVKIGTARLTSTSSGPLGKVFNRAGVRYGFVSYVQSIHKWSAAKGLPGDTGIRKQMFIEKNHPDLARWTLWSVDPKFLEGRVRWSGGRWRVQRMGDFYHTVGSVNDACPAWLAGGAVFILSRGWD